MTTTKPDVISYFHNGKPLAKGFLDLPVLGGIDCVIQIHNDSVQLMSPRSLSLDEFRELLDTYNETLSVYTQKTSDQ